ncbi:helix-turn-helix domain-containing protein [Lapidilactobacillus bayanensis]|uniref:helix-turn-helix domain-containing protein n=1 Tax=Lapidilactobacillus bayanensis TaxID=2485998 RepID=UPI000F7B5F89|nr:helix-turn-helix domain-containing protein [Lapidilactobacillus bayanensis]
MIEHENIQVVPRLPFKYYVNDPLRPIDVAPHWHQEIELNCLVSGAVLKFVADGRTTEYYPGDIWAVDHRVIHSATGAPRTDWHEFGLIIDDDFLLNEISESANWHLTLAGQASEKLAPTAYQAIQQHLLAIHDLLINPLTDANRLAILGHLYGLLFDLQQHFTTPLTTNSVNRNQPLIDQVMMFINQSSREPLTGQGLATKFHVSLTTLNQQFQANLQMPVNRYIRLVRLMNAHKLLLATNHGVNYIADQCGFSSGKTFNRNFKDWKGKTPSDYRKTFAKYHRIATTSL